MPWRPTARQGTVSEAATARMAGLDRILDGQGERVVKESPPRSLLFLFFFYSFFLLLFFLCAASLACGREVVVLYHRTALSGERKGYGIYATESHYHMHRQYGTLEAGVACVWL